MKYQTLEGDYLTAYQFCLKNGGQLFVGNGKDSANVCVVGQNCFTFWAKDSLRYQQVKELATYFQLEPETATGGRIARWIVEKLLMIPYEGTYWSRTYRNLAKQGSHWHYLHCDEKQQFYGIEVDLKSAYFSSLFTFPSLLYQPEKGYIDDNGAMGNLKELYSNFPKWFRLQFLGCLASWRIFYLCKDKKQTNSLELIKKQRFNIAYNASFNVAHRAILRNYKIMQRLHKIGGKYIRRIHTDSFFLDIDIPEAVEKLLWEYVEEKKIQYTVKGFGSAFFWDINTGFLGNKFIGARIDVVERMRNDGVKMKSKQTNEKVFNNPGLFLANAPNLDDLRDGNDSNSTRNAGQLELFTMESDNIPDSNIGR